MDGEDLAIAVLASRQAKQSQQLKDIQKWQEYQAAGLSRESIINSERREAEWKYQNELSYQVWAKWMAIGCLVPVLYFGIKSKTSYYFDLADGFCLAIFGVLFLIGVFYALVPPTIQKSYCWQLAEKMPANSAHSR